MTKAQLISYIGQRMGDQSAAFATPLGVALDFVLRDLTQFEAIAAVRKTATFTITAGTRSYNLRTITGLTSPNYPVEVERVVVYGWGTDGLIARANSDEEFETTRLALGETTTGIWKLWRVFPNEAALEVVPPASAVDAARGTPATITYIAPATALGANDDITEVRDEDLETIANGVIARMAAFKDETDADAQTAGPLYELGKRRMWARRFNSQSGRVEPQFP